MGFLGIEISVCSSSGILRSKGLDLLERNNFDQKFLENLLKSLILEWSGAIGWGFGCVFFLVSLGIFGWVLVWEPQIFLSSVEFLVRKVGKWVGGILGIAKIRCYYNSGVVIWHVWLPYTSVSFDFLFCDVWCGCVLLILWLFCKPRIELAIFVQRLGCMRLGISHNKGDIRQDQVFVYSLSGASTILAASAFLIKGLGCYVQGSCTSQGDIRLELVTMFRTFISSYFLFLIF
ncbi:hypothetical protein Hanom_Chr09g00774651 [Helianthus anomalus]